MNHVNEPGLSREFSTSDSFSPGGERGPDWERFCKELLLEREKTRAELQEATKERDLYRRALQALLPVDEVHFSKEDILRLRGQNQPLHKLISDLEKELSV